MGHARKKTSQPHPQARDVAGPAAAISRGKTHCENREPTTIQLNGLGLDRENSPPSQTLTESSRDRCVANLGWLSIPARSGSGDPRSGLFGSTLCARIGGDQGAFVGWGIFPVLKNLRSVPARADLSWRT